jgi:hypothetical protein
MNQRGRKSGAAMLIKPVAASLSAPLEPPQGMGEREAAEWRALVNSLGSGWFPRETHGLLWALCSVTVQLNDINEAMAAFGPGVPSEPMAWQRYRELTKMRLLVGGQLASLSTKLRLTNQSRSYPERAYTEAKQRLAAEDCPWNDDVIDSRRDQ